MPPTSEEFIARWSPSGGSERANYALFLSELCDVLGVKRPEVSTTAGSGEYVFEREVREVFTDGTSTPRFLDLYRKGSFVLEAKQGVEAEEQQGELARATSGKKARKKRGHGVRGTRSYDSAMVKAKAQAEAYARFLPATQGRRPSCWWWMWAIPSRSTASSQGRAGVTCRSPTRAATAFPWQS